MSGRSEALPSLLRAYEPELNPMGAPESERAPRGVVCPGTLGSTDSARRPYSTYNPCLGGHLNRSIQDFSHDQSMGPDSYPGGAFHPRRLPYSPAIATDGRSASHGAADYGAPPGTTNSTIPNMSTMRSVPYQGASSNSVSAEPLEARHAAVHRFGTQSSPVPNPAVCTQRKHRYSAAVGNLSLWDAHGMHMSGDVGIPRAEQQQLLLMPQQRGVVAMQSAPGSRGSYGYFSINSPFSYSVRRSADSEESLPPAPQTVLAPPPPPPQQQQHQEQGYSEPTRSASWTYQRFGAGGLPPPHQVRYSPYPSAGEPPPGPHYLAVGMTPRDATVPQLRSHSANVTAAPWSSSPHPVRTCGASPAPYLFDEILEAYRIRAMQRRQQPSLDVRQEYAASPAGAAPAGPQLLADEANVETYLRDSPEVQLEGEEDSDGREGGKGVRDQGGGWFKSRGGGGGGGGNEDGRDRTLATRKAAAAVNGKGARDGPEQEDDSGAGHQAPSCAVHLVLESYLRTAPIGDVRMPIEYGREAEKGGGGGGDGSGGSNGDGGAVALRIVDAVEEVTKASGGVSVGLKAEQHEASGGLPGANAGAMAFPVDTGTSAAVTERRVYGDPSSTGGAGSPFAQLPGTSAPASGAVLSVGGGPSLALPLTVFHLDRKCPKVLAPRSGKLGDTKHLVLPGEIVQALPAGVRKGQQPIRVRTVPLLPKPSQQRIANRLPQQQRRSAASSSTRSCSISRSDSGSRVVKEAKGGQELTRSQSICAHDEDEEVMCLLKSGPGGFPAIPVIVSEHLYGRRTEFFRLLPDLTLEVGVGDRVVRMPPRRASEGKITPVTTATVTGTFTAETVSTVIPAGTGTVESSEATKQQQQVAFETQKPTGMDQMHTAGAVPADPMAADAVAAEADPSARTAAAAAGDDDDNNDDVGFIPRSGAAILNLDAIAADAVAVAFMDVDAIQEPEGRGAPLTDVYDVDGEDATGQAKPCVESTAPVDPPLELRPAHLIGAEAAAETAASAVAALRLLLSGISAGRDTVAAWQQQVEETAMEAGHMEKPGCECKEPQLQAQPRDDGQRKEGQAAGQSEVKSGYEGYGDNQRQQQNEQQHCRSSQGVAEMEGSMAQQPRDGGEGSNDSGSGGVAVEKAGKGNKHQQGLEVPGERAAAGQRDLETHANTTGGLPYFVPVRAASAALADKPGAPGKWVVVDSTEAAGLRGGRGSRALPLTLKRKYATRQQQIVMRTSSGILGNKKHLPVPPQILELLPSDQLRKHNPRPVTVRVLDVRSPAGAMSKEADFESSDAVTLANWRETYLEETQCTIGPTGSHGCMSLQLLITSAMWNRTLLFMRLQVDGAIELGLGSVDKSQPPPREPFSGGGSGGGEAPAPAGLRRRRREFELLTESEEQDEEANLGGGGFGIGTGAEGSAEVPGEGQEGSRPKRRRQQVGGCGDDGGGVAAAAGVVAATSASSAEAAARMPWPPLDGQQVQLAAGDGRRGLGKLPVAIDVAAAASLDGDIGTDIGPNADTVELGASGGSLNLDALASAAVAAAKADKILQQQQHIHQLHQRQQQQQQQQRHQHQQLLLQQRCIERPSNVLPHKEFEDENYRRTMLQQQLLEELRARQRHEQQQQPQQQRQQQQQQTPRLHQSRQLAAAPAAAAAAGGPGTGVGGDGRLMAPQRRLIDLALQRSEYHATDEMEEPEEYEDRVPAQPRPLPPSMMSDELVQLRRGSGSSAHNGIAPILLRHGGPYLAPVQRRLPTPIRNQQYAPTAHDADSGAFVTSGHAGLNEFSDRPTRVLPSAHIAGSDAVRMPRGPSAGGTATVLSRRGGVPIRDDWVGDTGIMAGGGGGGGSGSFGWGTAAPMPLPYRHSHRIPLPSEPPQPLHPRGPLSAGVDLALSNLLHRARQYGGNGGNTGGAAGRNTDPSAGLRTDAVDERQEYGAAAPPAEATNTRPPAGQDWVAGGSPAGAAGAAATPPPSSGPAAVASEPPVSPAMMAAASSLGRAWVLLQQVPRVQLAATRALTAAGPVGATAGPEAAAALTSFRNCLAAILDLLRRAREAAAADVAAQEQQRQQQAQQGLLLPPAAERGLPAQPLMGRDTRTRRCLVAAAPQLLSAAECLVEWYHLLASTAAEGTAALCAMELGSSAALVRAQLSEALGSLPPPSPPPPAQPPPPQTV